MLFMVIEQFKNGYVEAIGERFRRNGRMLPVGVSYHASWVAAQNARCFQIMDAPDHDCLFITNFLANLTTLPSRRESVNTCRILKWSLSLSGIPWGRQDAFGRMGVRGIGALVFADGKARTVVGDASRRLREQDADYVGWELISAQTPTHESLRCAKFTPSVTKKYYGFHGSRSPGNASTDIG
jgi:hypothetical protein